MNILINAVATASLALGGFMVYAGEPFAARACLFSAAGWFLIGRARKAAAGRGR